MESILRPLRDPGNYIVNIGTFENPDFTFQTHLDINDILLNTLPYLPQGPGSGLTQSTWSLLSVEGISGPWPWAQGFGNP